MTIVKKTISLANQPPLSELDLGERAADWTDELEPEVPREYLMEAFTIARHSHNSQFPINYHELQSAWRDVIKPPIDREKAIIRAQENLKNPALNCQNKANHIDDDGNTVIISLFDLDRDEIAPCFFCRYAEYELWRKKMSGLYGEHQPKTIIPKTNEIPMSGIFVQKPEELISSTEADALAEQHNILVCQIVSDEATQNMQMVIFDEGANAFKHRNRNDKLYSAKDLRKTIERYEKILESK